MTDTLIIRGTGGSCHTVEKYLQEHPDAEFWTLAATEDPRATRHFEIHTRTLATWLNLREHKCPLFIRWDEKPQRSYEEPFPWEEMCKHFGFRYCTNTIAFMLAYAAYAHKDQFKRIYMPGCDFNANEGELGYQRACNEFWIGWHLARGTKVILPAKSSMLSGCYS